MLAKSNLPALLANIDLASVLESQGISLLQRAKKDEIFGWCPDHEMFTGRKPSHPKWSVNKVTGKTHCKTESRGSDIIHTLMRINNCDFERAVDILTGNDDIPPYIRFRIDKRKKDKQTIKKSYGGNNLKDNEHLQSMIKVVNSGGIYKRGLDFFEKDGIMKKTVIDFNIIELTGGKYKDRAIIPFYDEYGKEMVGFVAVDLLGKKKNTRDRVSRYLKYKNIENLSFGEIKELYKNIMDNYRKTLYCSGTSTGNHLYGFHKLVKSDDLHRVILVEGERDVLKLQQEGFPAVGTHGTHFSFEQSALLRKHKVREVIIAFDPDDAGRRASEKVYNEHKHEFDSIWELFLDKDPKYYDKESFEKALSNDKAQNKEQSKIVLDMIKNKSCLRDKARRKKLWRKG